LGLTDKDVEEDDLIVWCGDLRISLCSRAGELYSDHYQPLGPTWTMNVSVSEDVFIEESMIEEQTFIMD
jgi:hypothetical protein